MWTEAISKDDLGFDVTTVDPIEFTTHSSLNQIQPLPTTSTSLTMHMLINHPNLHVMPSCASLMIPGNPLM